MFFFRSWWWFFAIFWHLPLQIIILNFGLAHFTSRPFNITHIIPKHHSCNKHSVVCSHLTWLQNGGQMFGIIIFFVMTFSQPSVIIITVLSLSVVICIPPCVNGDCVANDTCNCAVGFTGALCETASTYKIQLNPFTNILCWYKLHLWLLLWWKDNSLLLFSVIECFLTNNQI